MIEIITRSLPIDHSDKPIRGPVTIMWWVRNDTYHWNCGDDYIWMSFRDMTPITYAEILAEIEAD